MCVRLSGCRANKTAEQYGVAPCGPSLTPPTPFSSFYLSVVSSRSSFSPSFSSSSSSGPLWFPWGRVNESSGCRRFDSNPEQQLVSVTCVRSGVVEKNWVFFRGSLAEALCPRSPALTQTAAFLLPTPRKTPKWNLKLFFQRVHIYIASSCSVRRHKTRTQSDACVRKKHQKNSYTPPFMKNGYRCAPASFSPFTIPRRFSCFSSVSYLRS